jgi:UPF0755 protein
VKRFILVVILLAVFGGMAAAATGFWILRQEAARSTVLPQQVEIEVRPGESLRRTAARLREAGLVGSERVFLAAAWWKGTDRRIKHGRHQFAGEVTLESVLEELTRTPKPTLRVTIPEGRTLREIALLLEQAGAVSASSYIDVACSPELRQVVGAPSAAVCAEGWLFPDTYDLVPGMSPGQVIDLQLRRFRQVVDPLMVDPPPLPPGLAEAERATNRLAVLLTLASIVEKETGQASERPHIASVFYNRLRIGMPLQTDPTVIYGVIASGLPWDGNLTRTHLQTETPWNTYVRKGLPPGPICNPGKASIEAVLRPLESRDLYFVARGDGSHQFSRTLDDHNRAVRRYQLR